VQNHREKILHQITNHPIFIHNLQAGFHMSELLAVATITILAVISPGPDFAMVTRNSYAFGARTGLISALGIGCGVQVHVMYTVFGIAIIIFSSPTLFTIMKLSGAGYLIFMGYQSFRNRAPVALGETPRHAPSGWEAFRMGFFTNALNPKTMLFVVATYTQVVRTDAPMMLNFAYGLFMSVAHIIWFGIVAFFFSSPRMRCRLLAHQSMVDKVIGLALMLLGVSLLFTHHPMEGGN
jgi:threonine/homoserine/homoserine lactone efflux protein